MKRILAILLLLSMACFADHYELGSLPFAQNATYNGYAVIGPAGAAEQLMLEYLLDEAGGTNASGLVDDTSGNNYDGTPTGISWTAGTNGHIGF